MVERKQALQSVRILFLSPRQCWPARSGAKLREYHFVRALARRGDLTYLHFTDPGAVPLTRTDLPFCHEVVAIPKPKAYGPGKLMQGMFGRWPVPILNYTSDEMSAAVDRLTRAAAFDLIHVDSIHMTRYPNDSSGQTMAIYNWHNIESEAMLRYSATVSSPPRRFYAQLTAKKLKAVEKEILRTAFGHVVCSDRERDQLLRIAPSARVAVVENGVDTGGFANSGENRPAQKIIFVGLMDYYPNVEAAISFTRSVWPHIRARFPHLSFSIVGANPVPSVVELANLEGVTVTGTVPDVRPYYRDAMAAVVPLRTGGGTRLKILEAMAAGVPVISTPLGAEGLTVSAGENVLLSDPDDTGKWVDHLAYLAEDQNGRQKLVDAALALVLQHYDWETLGQKLSDTYEGWLRGKA
jgi:sugar transferase (PEP-CTERM/EpsH1 system associated)